MGKFGKILILVASGYNYSDETTRLFSEGAGEKKVPND
jgi:hypothetical protein